MKTILLKIMTPEQLVSEQTVTQITLPIQDGIITIFPDHIPYIGALKAGEVIIHASENTKEEIAFAVSGGFVDFHDNALTLLADTAEYMEAIDIARAEEARERAALLMTGDHIDAEEYARAAASLERQLVRLRVARKHYTKRGVLGSSEEV